jgi:pyridoxine 5-phosphate synthase
MKGIAMARLSLCLNQVAKIRNMKKGRNPDPLSIAFAAEMAGIDGIIVQLREDRSDITDRDVGLLKEVVQTHLNLAIPMNDDMIKKALSWLPDMVTLLPSSAAKEPDRSLDAANTLSYLEEAVTTLRANGIVVTMLVDPEPQQIRAAARVQADYIQINTSSLAGVEDLGSMTDIVEQIRSVAIAANKIGLGVSAGRSLSMQSLRELADIKYIEEFNVGWAICSRAMLVGIEKAVIDFKKVLSS